MRIYEQFLFTSKANILVYGTAFIKLSCLSGSIILCIRQAGNAYACDMTKPQRFEVYIMLNMWYDGWLHGGEH